jgi:diguanylate cyclase (GGDEF)-like protein
METFNTYYEDEYGLKKFVEEHYNTLFDKKSTVLVQVFSGLCEKDFLKGLSKEIREMVPHVYIMGTTTAGEIMNGQVSGLKTVLSFSVFQHTNICSAFLEKDDQSDFQLGQIMASKFTSKIAKVVILFATGLTINATELLQGFQSINPTMPVAGGNAGDNSLMRQSFVFSNTEITDCGVIGVVLESEQLHVSCHWHLGWQPIGKEMTITEAKNLRIYTIDNMPAYQAYQKYLGLEDIGNFQNATEYPLVMNRHGVTMARVPFASYEDGSIGFLADINEGEKVRFSYGHVGTILEKIENLCQEIMQQPAEGIFVYTCTSRRGFLQVASEIETDPLQKIAPTAGFFTYGEFFHVADTNQLLNATMTILVLSESEKVDRPDLRGLTLRRYKSNHRDEPKLDNVAGRNIGVLNALTNLVNNVTDELVNANEKLKYISLHDVMTGLNNRAFFEQEMKRFDAYIGSVGIIICDIDGLKLINDLLGHSFGDRIICMAAESLTEACRPNDSISRIGGDEFAILVPDADECLLEKICSRITNTPSSSKPSGPKEVLHLSVGFALMGQHGTKNMFEAFKLADLNMYRKKSAESAKVQKIIVKSLTHIESRVGLEYLEQLEQENGSSYETIIKREWAETYVRREMERAAVLLRVSSQLNDSSYDNVFDVLCEESVKVLNASAAYLNLYDHSKEVFYLAAKYGLDEQACLMPSSPDIFDHRGIMIEDDASRLKQIEQGLMFSLNLKKLVRVRLVYKQQMIGVLNCCIPDGDFHFVNNDFALINGLADLAVVHIVKAQLWQENRRQLEAITALYNNARGSAHSLDMRNIAQDVCRTYVEAFGAPLAWLGKAEEDGSIQVIGAYPDVDYPYNLTVRWDESPAGLGPTGEAMRRGAPVIINDIRKDAMFNLWRKVAIKFGVESMASFPLISRGKVFGALMVYAESADFFDPEKIYYLQAYAHQAAASLQNAKLFEEAENRAACLEALREIDIAMTENLDLSSTLGTVLDQVMTRLQVDAADILLYDEESKTLTYAVGRGFCSSVAEQLPSHYEGEQTLNQRRELIIKEEDLPYYRVFHLLTKGKLQGMLEIFNRNPFSQDREWLTFADMLANQTTIAIDGARLLNDLICSNTDLTAAYDATIEGWSRILDLRDKETEGHSQRVTLMTLSLAIALGINESELIHYRRGALLHDIGKMGIPDSILLKPGALTEMEWEVMKKHPVYAYEMLFPIEYLRPALDIPYAHHEKWDGTGYPRRLKGKQIPLAARIFALVDVVDALASDRPYRKAWSLDQILEYIKSLSGSHFDPQIVDLFFNTNEFSAPSEKRYIRNLPR